MENHIKQFLKIILCINIVACIVFIVFLIHFCITTLTELPPTDIADKLVLITASTIFVILLVFVAIMCKWVINLLNDKTKR